MRLSLSVIATVSLSLALSVASVKAEDDEALAQDLKLLQGKWEMLHVNDAAGKPTLHSVKEIEGNRETLRRYDVKTGKLLREHTVEFKLSKSGDVHVFTFYAVGGDPSQGASFVYKVDADNFYDVPGLLQGDTHRNYQDSPSVFRWKRVKPDPKPAAENPAPAKP
jgi:hypothetical protein